MSRDAKAVKAPRPWRPTLPASLTVERRRDIAILRLTRPHKRNALDDTTVLGIEPFFSALPTNAKAVVVFGGASISPPGSISATDRARRGQRRRSIRDFGIAFRAYPVRQGAGGGGAAWRGGRRRIRARGRRHLRVAERSAYYALPEGSRGIFLGGGGSVRLPRLIGVSRVMEMMLTGRTYGAEEGQTFGPLSLSGRRRRRASPRASSSPSASRPTRR